MCQNCAKLIDSDRALYTVEKLLEWKVYAERSAKLALEGRRGRVSGSEGIFLEADRLMPRLIAEMRADISTENTELVRELVILWNRNVIFSPGKPRFVYYESEHPDIRNQIDWLEEMGMVVDATVGKTPIYRMVSEFVEWLREGATYKRDPQ